MTTRTTLKRGRMFVAAFAVGSLAFAACGSDAETNAASPAASAASQAEAHHGTGGKEVVMRLIAYRPDQLEVPADTAVVWKQRDTGFHTVTSGTVDKAVSGSVETNADGNFDSGRLAKDKEFTFTFAAAGIYAYFCEIHPATMSGRITVE